jgi:hypothetical protein
MKIRAASMLVFFVGVFVTAQAALAQFNFPREVPQMLDALKGRAEQPKPAAPMPSQTPTPSQAPAAAQPKAAASSAALEENRDYAAFKSWALDTQEPNPIPNMFKFCIDAYNKMIASGISPSTRVPEETRSNQRPGGPPIVYAGTVQEIKEKWCDAGGQKINADVAAKHAPYRAALKNDKLRLVIDETHGHVSSYAVAGGQYTSDAKRLAAASVWFLDIGPATNESQNCVGGGRKATVRRYAFDGQHNLTGTTSKQFCGSVPSSAYQ